MRGSEQEDRCIRVLILAALAAALILPSVDVAEGKCRTQACERRVEAKRCHDYPLAASRAVRSCIYRAARKYRQPYGDMLRVARCESGLNPRAVGFRIHRGLFQFNYPGTWSTTPYGRRDAFSARWNSLAAGWMWSVGRRGEWECQ